MEHIERNAQKSNATLAICITALFMALNIMMSSFGLPVPGGHLYLNDVIICTAAILLDDPKAAFIVGGVGAFLGDLFFYPTPMFVSLVTHGIQAVVICLLAHRGGKVSFKGAALGVILGAVIMVVGYSLGRAFIYSTPHYAYTAYMMYCHTIFSENRFYLLFFQIEKVNPFGIIIHYNNVLCHLEYLL